MNNTDINEVAQHIRRAAIIEQKYLGQRYETGSWQDSATPDRVLLILDALEAAQQYAKSRDEENQGLMLTVGRLRVERKQLEASQQVVPEWISVSDRLPENEDYVLAADSYDKYLNNPPRQQVACFGDWFGDGEATWDDGDGNDLILNQVTHWMPLPAAPALQEE